MHILYYAVNDTAHEPCGLAVHFLEQFMKDTVTSAIKRAGDVLHRIHVKLYPNQLPNGGGPYVARTSSEKVLTIDDICTGMENKGGFSGDKDTLRKYVKQHYDELVYRLCDGFAVNTGYFTLYPNVGGTFFSPKEACDRDKHPLDIRLRPAAALTHLLNLVQLHVQGFADPSGFIHQFSDAESSTVNKEVTGGGQFVITGDKIKIAGKHPDCGVYFELTDEPDKRIKVTRPLGKNKPSEVVGIAPGMIAPKSYRLVIVTQFSGSSTTLLKEPRSIVSPFELAAE